MVLVGIQLGHGRNCGRQQAEQSQGGGIRTHLDDADNRSPYNAPSPWWRVKWCLPRPGAQP